MTYKRLQVTVSLLVVLFFSSSSFASEDTNQRKSQQSIYVEALGPSFLGSVNYEYRLVDFAVRLGVGYAGITTDFADSYIDANALSFPITASYLGFHHGDHHMELGFGLVPYLGDFLYSGEFQWEGNQVLGTLLVGYRYQPATGGIVLRLGFSPIFGDDGGQGQRAVANTTEELLNSDSSLTVLPWFYLSIGVTK